MDGSDMVLCSECYAVILQDYELHHQRWHEAQDETISRLRMKGLFT